jgi:Protein of unknown function (DUF3311)
MAAGTVLADANAARRPIVYQMPVDRNGHQDWHAVLRTGTGQRFPHNGEHPRVNGYPHNGDRPVTHRATGTRQPAPVPRTRPADASLWHWLLVIPVLLPLSTPLYNRVEPTLLGFPFFYWFQLALAGFSAVMIALVYTLTRKRA